MEIETFKVKVANEDKLRCKEMAHDVKLNVQGVPIITDLHVLTIVWVEVVLGNTWLQSIG